MNVRLNKKIWLVALAFCSLAGSVASAAAAELQKVRVSVIPIADAAPFYAALEKGYFAAEGLNVEVVTSVGGATAIPALVSGALDVAYNNVVSALLAKAEGLDIRMVAPATVARMERSGVISRKADGIEKPGDLEGKVLAVNNRNTLMWLYARAWVKASGANPDKITFREVPFPQMGDALKQKQVDAIYTVDPFQRSALEDPSLARLANPNEIQPDVVTAVYVVAGTFVDQDKGATLAKFLRGLEKGNQWYNSNLQSPDLTDLIARYSRTNPTIVEKLPKGPAYIELNVASIRKTAALMREHKLLTTDVNLAEAVCQRP